MKKLFDIFIKKEEIVLDCFVTEPFIYDLAPIAPAMKHVPDWWKNTPSKIADPHDPQMATIKHCAGFIDYYKKGVVIPSWFDMELKIHELGHEKYYDWQSSNRMVSTDHSHPQGQWINFAEPNGQNMKLSSPWAFRTREDVQFTWTQPIWNHRKLIPHLTVLPAVVNYRYNHATEINFLIENKNSAQELNIPALTPLVILHCLSEKNVKIQNHLVTESEWYRIFGLDRLVFKRNGQDSTVFYHSKKKLKDQLDPKCPFH